MKAVSGDKMMNKALGPVWHRKQKELGIVPKNLRGLDKEATWSNSKADGWLYGHGSFCLVTHGIPIVGCFKWMRNAGNEAKRLWAEAGTCNGLVSYVCMDKKADDQALYREFWEQRKVRLVTSPNRKHNKTPARRKMIRELRKKKYRKIYKERSQTVEPMQGLIKELFELDRCWMRGDVNNRWLFAAMGVAVQMAQRKALRAGQSTWNIRQEVVGL